MYMKISNFFCGLGFACMFTLMYFALIIEDRTPLNHGQVIVFIAVCSLLAVSTICMTVFTRLHIKSTQDDRESLGCRDKHSRQLYHGRENSQWKMKKY
ncbi:MAG: hypothetical protein K0S76_478 [Herbinix sp.]|jgi:heme/copper-type cytochrome/quinol oxidase subunit 4|nr:hypothetical protein [Herbinix sp.]